MSAHLTPGPSAHPNLTPEPPAWLWPGVWMPRLLPSSASLPVNPPGPDSEQRRLCVRGPPPVILAAADYASVLTQIGVAAMGTGICAQIRSGAGKMVKGFYLWRGPETVSLLGCSRGFSCRTCQNSVWKVTLSSGPHPVRRMGWVLTPQGCPPSSRTFPALQ